jgi:flagellar basal-body rod protein FlgC
MYDPLRATMSVASSGLQAQSHRARIVSENLANAESTGTAPGSNPYTRKTITMVGSFDEALGATTVRIQRIDFDRTPYPMEHEPGHPAADANGFVKQPNVNMLNEIADIREANRSYEANLQVIRQARAMISQTIDLMRGP